jgi:hypothetical protein
MSLILRIQGGPATAGAQSGLDQLKESEAGDAKLILEQLRDKSMSLFSRTLDERSSHYVLATRRLELSTSVSASL